MTDMYHKRFLCIRSYAGGSLRFKKGVIYDFFYTGTAKQWSVTDETGGRGVISVVMESIWGDIFREIPLTVELENK